MFDTEWNPSACRGLPDWKAVLYRDLHFTEMISASTNLVCPFAKPTEGPTHTLEAYSQEGTSTWYMCQGKDGKKLVCAASKRALLTEQEVQAWTLLSFRLASWPFRQKAQALEFFESKRWATKGKRKRATFQGASSDPMRDVIEAIEETIRQSEKSDFQAFTENLL